MTNRVGMTAPPAGYDELFAAFLATTFAMDTPPRLAFGLAPESWHAKTAALVARAGPKYFARRQERESRLIDAFASVAPLVSDATIRSFADARFDVAPMPDLRASGDHDIYYAKINHGFWEQMYAAIAPPDPVKMRIKNPAERRARYLASGFADALAAAMEGAAHQEQGSIRFPGVQFAVSLASGSHDHADVLAGFDARSPVERQIVIGAAIGIAAWFEAVFPRQRPSFFDGSFPKRGLESGALRATLEWAASASQRIIFVVPPHLEGIRLTGTTTPQETFLVPATTIHEGWAACLHAVASHVLTRLAEDHSVLVITQSAVFSALLGLFLAQAKPRLLGTAHRLRYFDLGQVLDIAVPNAGGLWARHLAKGDLSLFRMDGT